MVDHHWKRLTSRLGRTFVLLGRPFQWPTKYSDFFFSQATREVRLSRCLPLTLQHVNQKNTHTHTLGVASGFLWRPVAERLGSLPLLLKAPNARKSSKSWVLALALWEVEFGPRPALSEANRPCFLKKSRNHGWCPFGFPCN